MLAKRRHRWVAALSGAALCFVGLVSSNGKSQTTPAGQPPTRMVWAWERPEDLRFVDPETTGIAFLAGTIRWSGEAMEFYPRMQPLVFPQRAFRMPVVRIERATAAPPLGTEAQLRGAAEAILEWSAGFGWVQLDYDAAESERPLYRQLLARLRQRLAPGTRLSITALASWCLGDRWIPKDLVDEIVPMLFDMGPDEDLIREQIARSPIFPEPACNGASGLVAGDKFIARFSGRRVYLFSRDRWSEVALR